MLEAGLEAETLAESSGSDEFAGIAAAENANKQATKIRMRDIIVADVGGCLEDGPMRAKEVGLQMILAPKDGPADEL